MIDEKKIEEAANKHFDNIVLNTELYQGDIVDAFKDGINWFLDNLKHNSNEKPKAGEEVFIQLREDKSWHSALFNGYDFDVNDMNKESEYSVQLIEITRWFYVEDLQKGGK